MNKEQFLKSKFARFKFTSLQLVFDPLITAFCCCCTHLDAFKRRKYLEKVSERFDSELDLLQILGKIRDSYDLIKHLVTPNEFNLLKINKDRVIDLDEEEQPEEEESEKEPSNSDICLEELDDVAAEQNVILDALKKSVWKGVSLNELEKQTYKAIQQSEENFEMDPSGVDIEDVDFDEPEEDWEREPPEYKQRSD